ncbi:ABC transporter substrate-binding protein [Halospeciosus flavus]
MAKLAHDKLDGIERVATIGPDYAYGHQCWEYFKAFSDGLGADYEYVASEFPQLGASDMTPQINSVMNANPDLVVTSFWAGDSVTFAQQAASQGLFDQAVDVFDTLGADPTVFESLGNSMPEGYHYSSWYWHSSFDNEENRKFLQDYWNEYKDDSSTINIPSFTGPSTTSALWLLKRAMEKNESTSPSDIISGLEGAEYTGPRGTWTMDADTHQASAPTSIGKTARSDADGNDGPGPGVPYDGVGLDPAYAYSLDRATAKELLSGSGLPPGV